MLCSLILAALANQTPLPALDEAGRYSAVSESVRYTYEKLRKAVSENRVADAEQLSHDSASIVGKSGHFAFDELVGRYAGIYSLNHLEFAESERLFRLAADAAGHRPPSPFKENITFQKLAVIFFWGQPTAPDFDDLAKFGAEEIRLHGENHEEYTTLLLRAAANFFSVRLQGGEYKGGDGFGVGEIAKVFRSFLNAWNNRPIPPSLFNLWAAGALAEAASGDSQAFSKIFALISKRPVDRTSVLEYASLLAWVSQLDPERCVDLAEKIVSVVGVPQNDVESLAVLQASGAEAIAYIFLGNPERGSKRLAWAVNNRYGIGSNQFGTFKYLSDQLQGSAAQRDLIVSLLSTNPQLLTKGKASTALAELVVASKSSDFESVSKLARRATDELGNYPSILPSLVDLRAEADIHLGKPVPFVRSELLEARTGYLNLWTHSLLPRLPVGATQEASGNPLERIGLSLANYGDTADGFRTIEVGRGWGAMSGIYRNKEKAKLLDQLCALPDIQKIQAWIAKQPLKTIALSYVIIRDRAPVVFVLDGRDLRMLPLNSTFDEVATLCSRWTSAIVNAGEVTTFGDESGANEGKLCKEISKILLGPVERAGYLRGVGRLLVTPDGPTLAIPTVALKSEDGAYLIENYRVVIAPALRNYVIGASSGNELVASMEFLGGIDLDAANSSDPNTLGGLSSLKALHKKASELAARYPGAKFMGAKLTKAATLASIPHDRIINFVTHGILNPNRPLDSFLSLGASGLQRDGISAREIANSTLNAKLACLWACNSASGKVSGGDGMLGLAWAFQTAGCRSVLGSKWEIEETATAQWMDVFYEKLLGENRDVDDAFSRTARTLKGFHPKPYFWAGFELYGSFGSVGGK